MSRLWLAGGTRVDPAGGTTGDLFVEGGVIAAEPSDRAGWRRIDCAGAWVAPGFVDLYADLADPEADGAAALRGGFTTVVHGPVASLDTPIAVRDRLARAPAGGPRTLLVPAATRGLTGVELADLGAFAALGAVAVGCGRHPPADPRVLRGLLAYAAGFGLTVFCRAAEPLLEEGGLAREGPRAARAGLPGIPAASEVIGIARLAALARAAGASVHVTHTWTAEGVAALGLARSAGARLTASATVAHLALDDDGLLDSGYAGVWRTIPPLGDPGDRRAIAAGLAEGVLAGIATDHRPLPAVAQEVEYARAEAGMAAFGTAFPLVLAAFGGAGEVGDPDRLAAAAAVVRALSVGPAGVLGRAATLLPGAPADVVVLDPAARWTVGRDLGSGANSPLVGSELTGAVRWVVCRGALQAG